MSLSRMKAVGLASMAIMITLRSAGAVEYIPIYNLNLMGGQYFFSSQKSSLSGNFMGNVAPVVKVNDQWSILPLYNSNYQGTKPVTDPVGSATLFQQSWDNRASVTGIYSMPGSDWRLKPSAGFKYAMLKETRDEQWGKGLFDYEKTGAGFEAENVYKDPFSYRIGVDFYFVHFPNYSSLESQAGVDPLGNPLYRAASGTHVLDTYNQQVSLAASRPFPYDDPKVSLQADYSMDWQTFPDQPIINLQGQPTGQKRQDFIQSLSLSAIHPQTLFSGQYRLLSRFGVGAGYDGSNQNEFDAANGSKGSATMFIFDDYSYYNFSIGPSFTLAWGDEKEPTWANIGFTYSRTQYTGRQKQDSDGSYTGANQWQDRYLITAAYSYPIAPHMALKAQTNVLWATSNMSYQALYRYTYNTANYLFGFTYDY